MARIFLTIMLLVSTYFVAQLYQLYDNDYYNSLGKISWNYCGTKEMFISWNVKYLSEEVNRVIEAIVMLLIVYHLSTKIQPYASIYKLCLWMYLTYRILDICFWFYNFKTYDYYKEFYILAAIEAIVWFWMPIKNGYKKLIKTLSNANRKQPQ